jgi:3-vinyl bacteriochlorophyllide hydratase
MAWTLFVERCRKSRMHSLHISSKSVSSHSFCECEAAPAIEQGARCEGVHAAEIFSADQAGIDCVLSNIPVSTASPATAERSKSARKPLYTPEQRARRDATPWTLVQAILAPLQFLVFLISLGLVAYYLGTGKGYEAATISILIKTFLLYTIMITGSIWEKIVFDEWLFVEAFFWEDVFSMLVLALQTLYVVALLNGWWTPEQQVYIAVAAYGTYVINAAQFLWKLRVARLEGRKSDASSQSGQMSSSHAASGSNWAGQQT